MGNWSKLKADEKVRVIKFARLNGVSDINTIRDTYNLYSSGGLEEILNKVNSSNANFVQRLKDPNRKNIPDWESPTDRISTHKLSVGTDENGNHYIFPEVQEINGELIDFTRPPYHRFAGEISAEMRGDTVRVPSLEDAIKFTEVYKQYYPFNNGGNLVHKYGGELVGLSLKLTSLVKPTAQLMTISGFESPSAVSKIDLNIIQDYISRFTLLHPNVNLDDLVTSLSLVPLYESSLGNGVVASWMSGKLNQQGNFTHGVAFDEYQNKDQEINAGASTLFVKAPKNALEHELLGHGARDIALGSTSGSTDREKEIIGNAYPFLLKNIYSHYNLDQEHHLLAELLATNTQLRAMLQQNTGLYGEAFNKYVDSMSYEDLYNSLYTLNSGYYSNSDLSKFFDYNVKYTEDEQNQINELQALLLEIKDKRNKLAYDIYEERQNENVRKILGDKYDSYFKDREKRKLNYDAQELEVQDLLYKLKENSGIKNYKNANQIEAIKNALKTVAYNNINPFEVSNNTYLAAFGGPLTHKKSGEELGESLELLNQQNSPILDPIRLRLYRHIYPSGYQDAFQRIVGALMGKDDVLHTAILDDGSAYAETHNPIHAEKKQYLQTGAFADEQMKYRDDIFATYLGIPQSERRNFPGRVSLIPSQYKPTKNSKGINTPYYTFPKENIPWDNLIKEALGLGVMHIYDDFIYDDFVHYPLTTNQNTTRGGAMYNALGEYTLGMGYDANKGLYVSMYDLWDLAPFGKGDSETLRFKNEGKDDASFGIGTPVLIYDRMYLDDYYGLTGNERGSYYLPEVTVTAGEYDPVKVGGITIYDERINQKSTGGPLYPFSFEKNPFLKTPVVRYDEGGQTYTVKKGDTFSLIALNVGVSVLDLQKLNPTITNVNRIREGLNINIPTYMFSEIFNTPQSIGLSIPQVLRTQPLHQQNTPILSVVVPTQKGLKTAGPLDLQELAVRQAYTESRLRPDIVNDKGAYGLFQIMLPALDDYNRVNKTNYTLEDMKNADNNIKVRNWYMDYLSNLGFINKGDIQSDSVGMYKVLASFNAGAGNVKDALTRAKADGKDIYDSWDWVSYLWDEPREYADFILRGIETKGTNKNDSVYKAVSTAKSGTANKIRSSVKL